MALSPVGKIAKAMHKRGKSWAEIARELETTEARARREAGYDAPGKRKRMSMGPPGKKKPRKTGPPQ